jgi:acetyltransferase-like isoleucine patch superfamily enzyme
MALTINGAHGNHLDVDPALAEALTGNVTFVGEGNALTIASPFTAYALMVHLGGGARARIDAGCCAGQLELYVPQGGTIAIGAGCAFNGHVRLLAHEPARIELGRGCLLAADVVVTASDMHAVVDRFTRVRLNPAADVRLGDRVWVGFRAFIGKGACIGEGAIIGACSVVTGAVPAHVMAAGQPARVRKHDIDWSFDLGKAAREVVS